MTNYQTSPAVQQMLDALVIAALLIVAAATIFTLYTAYLGGGSGPVVLAGSCAPLAP